MNKKLILLFLTIIFVTSCETLDVNHENYVRVRYVDDENYIREGYYRGKKMDSIIKKLGKDYGVRQYTVNQDYWFLSEREPDYWKYFSKEAIDYGVVVYEYWWRGEDTEKDMDVVVWAAEEYGVLKVFASLEYNSRIVEF